MTNYYFCGRCQMEAVVEELANRAIAVLERIEAKLSDPPRKASAWTGEDVERFLREHFGPEIPES